MPTLLSHPVVPVACAAAVGLRRIAPGMLLAGIVACLLPDLDGLAYRWGIASGGGSMWGHRGYTHTWAFAALVALPGLWWARRWGVSALAGFIWLFVACLSHPVLDMFTNGGAEIPLLWPITAQRLSADWRPIEVSPIALSRFLSARGMVVLQSELLYLWLPALLLAASLRQLFFRRAQQRKAVA